MINPKLGDSTFRKQVTRGTSQRYIISHTEAIKALTYTDDKLLLTISNIMEISLMIL